MPTESAEQPTSDYLVNLVGAVVIALGDQLRAGVSEGAEHGAAAPAALVALRWEPGCSIDALTHTLGLTHSGVVRLVDRLQTAGLVERRERPAGGRLGRRSVALHLTEVGQDVAQRVLAYRHAALAPALAGLGPDQRAALEGALESVLAAVTDSPDRADAICRLCDPDACPDERCPVERAARASDPAGDRGRLDG